jgi:citronellol/citronellal dehydrogenase
VSLRGKTLFITGASRGIGKAIGLRAAQDGANIAVVGKTDTPHPKLEGTVHSAVQELQAAGGRAIACVADIRFEEQVAGAVARTLEAFGGIDILVNNASAISLTSTEQTDLKRFDLMHQVNTRGTFLCSKLCLPALRRAENPHILMLAPPLHFEARWFAPHLAYSLAKYGMSLCVLGLSEELKRYGIGVNALWPKTAIGTAAIANVVGGASAMVRTRRPEIIADAAHVMLTASSRELTGRFMVDEDVLRAAGQHDFSRYADVPDSELMPDFFI